MKTRPLAVETGSTKRAQHTPGPWNFSPRKTTNHERGMSSSVGARVTVAGRRLADVAEPMTDEGEANARLIAQAPAMLGELSAFRSLCLRLRTGELTVGAGDAGARVVIEAGNALRRIDAILAAIEGDR